MPVYEDGTECSETSAYTIQTLGNYPEESIQQAISCSVGLEIFYLLLGPQIHHRLYIDDPLGCILSQMNPVYNLTPYFNKIHFCIMFPSYVYTLSLRNWFL